MAIRGPAVADPAPIHRSPRDLDALLSQDAELTDADYDRLYVVMTHKVGQGEVLLFHYGGPSTSRSDP